MSNTENDEDAGRNKALADVKLYQANDWKLKEETAEYFVLTRNSSSTGVHIVIALFLGWYLLFIPNIIYHFMKKETKKLVK